MTEMPNPLTENIDIADAATILGMLEQTDEELIRGIRDVRFLDMMRAARRIIVRLIVESVQHDSPFKIILSGAGTSGRLAMLLAEAFNPLSRECIGIPIFSFTIAGGHLALIKAQEGAEDDPRQGMVELDQIVGDAERFITIGITCGFSAHYVSGQLYHTVVHRKQPAILVGFNPVERARTVSPENWNKSFRDVLEIIRNESDVILLNPCIGPEPVTGSTRMKGATATKIILETLFADSLYAAAEVLGNRRGASYPDIASNVTSSRIEGLIDQFASAKMRMYALSKRLVPALEMAGEALNHQGHIYYVGEGIAGKWGIVDASECPPTFGADFEDVRGFIPGGWTQFCTSCPAHTHVENRYDIDVEQFRRSILPELQPKDLIVFTGSDAFYRRFGDLVRMCEGSAVYRIGIRKELTRSDLSGIAMDLNIEEAEDWKTMPVFTSTMIKLMYNAVTTAAHIFRGKVYKNKMIDLRISNNKLYHRAIRIIGELMHVDQATAFTALLKSIYRADSLEPAVIEAPVSSHIVEGTGRDRIIPVALLLATGRFDFQTARERVEKEHIVRNIIKNEPGSG